VEGDEPAFLILAGDHVVQQFHQVLAKGGAGLAAAALGVLRPVEVVHLEVGRVLALGVALGIAAARFRAIAD